MADENGAAQSAQTWPVPEFHFSVDITDVGKSPARKYRDSISSST